MLDRDAILERLHADLARRRLPERVEDPAVLSTIGALLRRPTPTRESGVTRDARAA